MRDKVAEVDYNSASRYEGGSESLAQSVWRLAALAVLRAIDFLVCLIPETAQAPRRARFLPALFGIIPLLARKTVEG